MPETESKPKNKLAQYWHMLGPGLTTGAADDDPSGIATYSQAGASTGFSFLWTAVFTFPFMAIIQEMCARIGIVTGRGLAGVISRNYPKGIIYSVAALLFVANTFNLAADLGIMAHALQLLFPVNFNVTIIVITLMSLYLQIFISYSSYARVLKWLALVLVSYVLTGIIADVNWREVFTHSIWPNFSWSKENLVLLTAILGTTISPYLFFWQTSQEVEEQIQEGKTSIKSREAITTKEDVRSMRFDVWSGMFLSNLVMFFIIAVCASTLFANGVTNIETAAQAAQALKPLAGNAAYWLFTLGIIGTGMLAVPVLAGSSSYVIAESLGWKEGLYRKFHQAYYFYGVIILSMFIGMVVNFLNLDAIKMLIYSAVLNGLIAPIILALIVSLAGNKKIMKEWSNKPLTNFLGWLITILMGIASIVTIWYLIFA